MLFVVISPASSITSALDCDDIRMVESAPSRSSELLSFYEIGESIIYSHDSLI